MKLRNKIAAGSAVAVASAQTFAYDWSTVTGAIDFSGETTAVAAVIGLLAGVAVVMKGGKMVLRMLGN